MKRWLEVDYCYFSYISRILDEASLTLKGGLEREKYWKPVGEDEKSMWEI